MKRPIGTAAAALLLAGCATAPVVERHLSTTLTGYQAVPGPGDLDGTGIAAIRLDPGGNRLCWELSVRGIAPATAVHIHRGAAGTSGPPVVPFAAPDAGGRSEGCAPVPDGFAAEMGAAPHLFYVNVHNQEFPESAIRGQLRGRSPLRPQRRRSSM